MIIGGVTQHSYHTIPNDLDLIITNPTKVGIFSFLGQIGYSKFPEFIADILTKIEKHTLVDITDGPADEKQDILTIASDGSRCLTQCKHTTDISKHSNGDELDILVAACMRKDCKTAIFATNADLTPQAKRYVTDKEYERGQKDKDDLIVVDYWNDAKIWDKIKDNTDILNKWFGGLGQTHGMRNFKFELTVQELPYDGTADVGDNFDSILAVLQDKARVAVAEDGSYRSVMPDGTRITIRKWFQFTSRLNINYVAPNNDRRFLQRPLYALTVEVSVPNAVKYAPTDVQKAVVVFLLDEVLDHKEGKWWHMTASQAKSFVFLHDISETREVVLNVAQTFIKVSDAIIPELEYCALPAPDFELQPNEDDDDSIFIHKPTGIQVVQMFDQLMDRYSAYEHQELTLRDIDRYREHHFRAVEGIDAHMMMRVRKIIDYTWVAIQIGKETLAWGIPPDAETAYVKTIERKLHALGLRVLMVEEEQRDKILSNVKKDTPPPMSMITAELKSVSVPIALPDRIFWLSKEIELGKDLTDEQALELVKFKYSYENSHGYDNMRGKTEIKSHTSELPSLLFDFFNIRGARMLDISINDEPITISVRFRVDSIADSGVLAAGYIREFEELFIQVRELLGI